MEYTFTMVQFLLCFGNDRSYEFHYTEIFNFVNLYFAKLSLF